MGITKTVTQSDLIAQYDDEIAELDEAFADLTDDAQAQHGAQEDWPEDTLQQIMLLHQSKQRMEEHRHALAENILPSYSDEPFELEMMNGRQLTDMEVQLQSFAQSDGVAQQAVEQKRKRLAVDQSTISAPPEVSTDENGSPAPSEEPNVLLLALYDFVEDLNNSGTTDFTARGFEEELEEISALSEDLPPAAQNLSDTGTDATDSPDSGDSS